MNVIIIGLMRVSCSSFALWQHVLLMIKKPHVLFTVIISCGGIPRGSAARSGYR